MHKLTRHPADTERYANEVIAYFATQLAEAAGTGFKDASLDYLADFWLDESGAVHQLLRSHEHSA